LTGICAATPTSREASSTESCFAAKPRHATDPEPHEEVVPGIEALLKRRQVVEPVVGHMKTDGLLPRNWPKGEFGDALHPVMCGAAHNQRLILARLRALLCALIDVLAALIHGDALGRSGSANPRYRFAI
jgi:hypothetical protein